ncbi:MAG: phosphodiester glycosidase family protein [Hyphomonadaceae bacterium]|nr:phosphodiester glycosidase family protein [Hyphomonadaceae bacterium]
MHWPRPDTCNTAAWPRSGVALLLAGALGACSSLVAADPGAGASGPSPVARPDWQSYARIEVATPAPQVWHVVRLDLAQVRLAVSPGDPGSGSEYRARTTSAALAAADADIAVNGGFYAIPDVADVMRGSVLDVMGTSIAGGVTYSQPQTGARTITATLCIAAAVQIVDGQTCPDLPRDALSAGPLLLRDGHNADLSGQSEAFALARHPRTAFAINASGTTGWLVVADGRQEDSAGVSLPELAVFMAALGADDAINLDGGGSSALVVRGRDGPLVVSSPIEAGVPGQERAVANHLLVFRVRRSP